MQNYDFVHQQTQKEFICEWVLIKYNFDNYNAHGYWQTTTVNKS